jgi:DNA mismatch endonuclease (patch repair protein)
VKELPGTPDLVFPKYGAVVFVHGCFWHRHEGCRFTTMPGTNQDFWGRKFQENVSRDRRYMEMLRSLGWRAAIVWECALKHSVDNTAKMVVDWLHGHDDILIVDRATASANK